MLKSIELRTALASATMLTFAAPAFADLKYANDTGGSVQFYGQLSPAYLNVDDGEDTDGNLVDNARSNSRVGLNLDQKLDNGQKLRFKFETALGAPQSSKFSLDEEPTWEWQRTSVRKLELIWSGTFGAVSVGQGSMASDGIATVDNSKTTMASTVTVPDAAGGYDFRVNDGSRSGIEVGDVFDDFDGGRKGRVRYDTPKFGGTSDDTGVSFALAYGEEILKTGDDAEYYDIGVFYDDSFGDVAVEGALGYAWKDDDDISESYAGSVSVVHEPTGLNGTLAAGGDPDGGTYGYIKLGWIASFWDVGYTAFSADYYGGSDFEVDGSESSSAGVQVAQKIDSINMELYFGYNRLSYDDDAANYEDMDVILTGLRWKF